MDMLKDNQYNSNIDDLNFGFEGNDKTIVNIPPDINESNIYPRYSEIDRTNINDFTNMSNLNSQFGGQNFDEDFGFNNNQFFSKPPNYFGGQHMGTTSLMTNNHININNNIRQNSNYNVIPENKNFSNPPIQSEVENHSNVNFNNNSQGNITMQNNSIINNNNNSINNNINNTNNVNDNKTNEFKVSVFFFIK
jgi:hypothetical protein